MEVLISNIRAANPQIADSISNEYNNSLRLLEQQCQTQIDQQLVNYNKLLENHQQLQTSFDEIKVQNVELVKQITCLTSEVSKLTNLIDDDSRSRKKPSLQKKLHQSQLNSFIKTKNPNSDRNANISNVNSKAHDGNSNEKMNDDDITSLSQNKNHNNSGDDEMNEKNATTNSKSIGQKNQTADDITFVEFSDFDEENDTFKWWAVENKKKKIKNIQPIVVECTDGNSNALRNTLANSVGTKDYFFKQNHGGAPVKIISENDSIRKKIIESLKSHGFGFSSFCNGDEKRKCFILRGIFADLETDTIKKALISSGCFDENIEVNKHVTGFMKQNPNIRHSNLFKVTVPANFDTKILNNINVILGMTVKWESLKSKPVMQCRNCQRFFHSSSQCFYPKRCVKCTIDHGNNICPRNKNPNLPVRCINCNGEHSANNLAVCEYFNKKIAPLIKNSNNNTSTTTSKDKNRNNIKPLADRNAEHNNKTKSIGSWADIVSNSQKKSQSTTSMKANPGINRDAALGKILETLVELVSFIKNG